MTARTQQVCPVCLYTFNPGQKCLNCAERIADELVPEGCIAVGNEHGACMDRGCRWCHVYYYGPNVLKELDEMEG